MIKYNNFIGSKNTYGEMIMGTCDLEVESVVLTKALAILKESFIKTFESANISVVCEATQTLENVAKLNAKLNSQIDSIAKGFVTVYSEDSETYESAHNHKKCLEFRDQFLIPFKDDAEIRAAMKKAMLRIAEED